MLLNWCHSESEDVLHRLLLPSGDKCGHYGAAAINRRRGGNFAREQSDELCCCFLLSEEPMKSLIIPLGAAGRGENPPPVAGVGGVREKTKRTNPFLLVSQPDRLTCGNLQPPLTSCVFSTARIPGPPGRLRPLQGVPATCHTAAAAPPPAELKILWSLFRSSSLGNS